MFFTASAGMPHDAALFSTYLTTLASASVKTPRSLQASSGVALRWLAARTALARSCAAARNVRKSIRQDDSRSAADGAAVVSAAAKVSTSASDREAVRS